MATKKKKEKEVVVTNVKFSKENENFKNACEKNDVPATKRQASKFRMGKGKAYKGKRQKLSLKREGG